MVGCRFSGKFLFHSLHLSRIAFLVMPKINKVPYLLLWHLIKTDRVNKERTATSLKFAWLCIHLHAEVIPLCRYLLISHAVDYVWTLIMCFSSLRLWPWLSESRLSVPSLGNAAHTQREAAVGRPARWGRQSLRAINNWVGLEPCTSWW